MALVRMKASKSSLGTCAEILKGTEMTDNPTAREPEGMARESADRRCGTCEFFGRNQTRSQFGFCTYPMPACVRRDEMANNWGENCPTWKQKGFVG